MSDTHDDVRSGADTDTHADVRADTRADVHADAVSAPRRPWWHWRRLTRGRLRPALAAAVAGAVLGGAGVAWQTGTGPFTDERACWGALGKDDVAALFGGKTDIRASEVELGRDRVNTGAPSGQCRLQSPRGRRITVQVHQLDVRQGGSGERWADEFLSARLTPLGGGLLGMASDTRAWLAVPDGCTGRPEGTDGPLVFDMETGWTVYEDEVGTGQRDQLARAVVTLVNGFLADEGCEGVLADPVARMAEPARFQDREAEDLCGIEGLRLPGKGRNTFDRPLVTNGEGPVRTCDSDVVFDRPRLRLMTVEDPRLSELYKGSALREGERIEATGGTGGRGFISDDLGLYQAACQTGDVTFLVRSDEESSAADIRALLPRYVAAEADRIGCGPLRLTLPG
ncbi:hypothetical protein ACWGBX_14505 [Streptomyces sp. NPDC055037]|uniref:hypothetical protein n=1 Tax=Streptomyces sp. NPDC059569 TaxID=3346869 RepID=UPI0036B5836B